MWPWINKSRSWSCACVAVIVDNVKIRKMFDYSHFGQCVGMVFCSSKSSSECWNLFSIIRLVLVWHHIFFLYVMLKCQNNSVNMDLSNFPEYLSHFAF